MPPAIDRRAQAPSSSSAGPSPQLPLPMPRPALRYAFLPIATWSGSSLLVVMEFECDGFRAYPKEEGRRSRGSHRPMMPLVREGRSEERRVGKEWRALGAKCDLEESDS